MAAETSSNAGYLFDIEMHDEDIDMDQMLVWALIHDLLSRGNRQRRPPVSGDPFWGDGWGALRTMWSGLDDRRPPDRIDGCR